MRTVEAEPGLDPAGDGQQATAAARKYMEANPKPQQQSPPDAVEHDPFMDDFQRAVHKGLDEVTESQGADPFKQRTDAPQQQQEEKKEDEPVPEDKKEEAKEGEGGEQQEEKGEDKGEPAKEGEAEPKSATARDWKKLKAATAERMAGKDKEIAELRAQISEAKKAPEATTEVVEQLTKERDELLSRLSKVALSQDPRFQQRHGQAIGAAETQIKAIAGEKGDEIMRLVQLGQSESRTTRLEDAVSELSVMAQGQIGAAIMAYDQAVSNREGELANHRESIAAEAQSIEAARAQEAKVDEAKKQTILNTVLSAAKENYTSFQEIDGDADHNAEVKENEMELAAVVNGQLSSDMVALMHVLATEGKRVMEKVVPEKDAKIKELEETISKLSATGAAPSEGGETQGSTPSEPMDFMSAVLKNLPSGG